MKSSISGLVAAAATAVLILGTSTRADAALIAYICDDQFCTGGGDTIVVDQGVGDNFPGSTQVGQINAGAVTVGGFTIITNVSQSKPLIGSAAAPQMDLAFTATTNDAALHTIWLYASDTGFTGTGPLHLQLGGTQPPPGVGNTIRGAAWGGTSNTNLDLTTLRADTGTSGVTPFALTADGFLASAFNPYSMTIGVVIVRSAAGTTTGDLHVQVVPEPATLALVGLALAGLGFSGRRKRV